MIDRGGPRGPIRARAAVGVTGLVVAALVVATPMVAPPVPVLAAPTGVVVASAPGGHPGLADLPVPQPSPEASRQEADDILSGAEYQEPPKGALERVFEWFAEQIAKLQPGSTLGVVGWILLALLVGVAVLMLSRLRRTARAPGDDAGYVFDLEDRRPPHEWLADAERFEGRGEWKQALRCRFRAMVGELILIGSVRDLPGRTTGEYRVELRRHAPAAAEAFTEASLLFEAAWYGDEPTGAEQVGRFRTLAPQVVAAARAAADATDEVRA